MSFKEKSKTLEHFFTHRKLENFPLWENAEEQEATAPALRTFKEATAQARKALTEALEVQREAE